LILWEVLHILEESTPSPWPKLEAESRTVFPVADLRPIEEEFKNLNLRAWIRGLPWLAGFSVKKGSTGLARKKT